MRRPPFVCPRTRCRPIQLLNNTRKLVIVSCHTKKVPFSLTPLPVPRRHKSYDACSIYIVEANTRTLQFVCYTIINWRTSGSARKGWKLMNSRFKLVVVTSSTVLVVLLLLGAV